MNSSDILTYAHIPDRLALAFTARHARAKDELALAQQRQTLAAAIDSFHRAATKHLTSEVLHRDDQRHQDPTLFGAEWDYVQTDNNAIVVDGDRQHPEYQTLALPSTLGMPYLLAHNLTALGEGERRLRLGQMDDALQGIRTGIGYKSLLYRTKVRNASSYRARLRSYDDIHVAEEAIRKHVRVYMQARSAIARLYNPFNPEDMAAKIKALDEYKTIDKRDLGVSTAVIESFTPGLRNEHAAWFWTVQDAVNTSQPSWMHDCECY